MAGLFVTFHGIDGTGKTTSAAEFCDLFASVHGPCINYDLAGESLPNPFRHSKTEVQRTASPSAQLAFFLGSTLFHSDAISKLAEEGYSIVKSRYLDDVLAHHAHLGVTDVEKIAAQFPIVQPDLKVILVTDEEVRRQRIDFRGIGDERDAEVKTLGSRAQYFEDYLLEQNAELLRLGKALLIDTSDLSPREVGQEVMSHVVSRIIGTQHPTVAY